MIAPPCDEAPTSAAALPRRFPDVAKALRARGVELDTEPGESLDRHQNRLGTQLMALYRDTRSTESFEALYRLAEPSVHQWIRGLLHRGIAHLDTRELLQETFINVYRYPGAFREDHPGSFRVWVRTIAGNIVRRASGRGRRVSFQELPEGLQEPADVRGGPDLAVVSEEEARNLQASWLLFLGLYARAWEGLSQRDRRTLHLVEVEGLSYREAGEVLGVGRSNMKMIVFRSRKRIARFIRATLCRARFGGAEATDAA